MAVIRIPDELNDSINYMTALSLLCILSCFITMLKFGGFKATLNFATRNKNKERDGPALPMIGAYRTNRDEFYANGSVSESSKKISASTVALPQHPELKPNKSISDLDKYIPVQGRHPNVSLNPRGEEGPQSINPKEQKKLQKQRAADQKAKEKTAVAEAKQEKSRKEKEKKETQKQTKECKKGNKKSPAPQAPVQRANPLAQGPSQYSTNTLDSSISKSSGPPPYSENQEIAVVRQVRTETNSEQITSSENVSFSKPLDTGGDWDMITQHRRQITRPTTTTSRQQTKRVVMDLNYNFGSTETKEDNSEA